MKKPRKSKPEEYKPRIPDILRSLSSEPQWIILLQGRNKPYDRILSDLHHLFQKMNTDEKYDFSVSGISKAINISTSDLSKWSRQLYDDIFELNLAEPELFKTEGKKFDLNFEAFTEHADLTLWLNFTPRKDEIFKFDFLNARLRFSMFYVEEVDHEFCDGKNGITVFLGTHKPNTYRTLIHDKALFYHLIGIIESFPSQSALDERLIRFYPH
jgi:hypothetical protein